MSNKIEAIRALIRGEYDNAALLSYGPLKIGKDAEILRICDSPVPVTLDSASIAAVIAAAASDMTTADKRRILPLFTVPFCDMFSLKNDKQFDRAAFLHACGVQS